MTTCPNCGRPVADEARFCDECGYDLTAGVGSPVPTTSAPTGSAATSGEPTAEPTSAQTVVISAAGRDVYRSDQPASSSPATTGWVAEVWVDPNWYQGQQTTHQLPAGREPLVVRLGDVALIGRRSTTRGVQPEIDCSADPGVSRRHAQLLTNGEAWFVEDLGSSNGSFVARAGANLPEVPIQRGVRVELHEGDSLYVGAWTRIDLRRA